MIRTTPAALAALTLLSSLTVSLRADACGCFAPPIPTPGAINFAVNQQAEQIIFEVGEGTISAHVRILYQGDPEQFGWMLPMPNVPDLELSNTSIFGLIDQQTAPVITANTVNLCPQQKYYCRQHPPCPVPREPTILASESADAAAGGPFSAAPNVAASGAPVAKPPVEVLAQERIGSYDTVTFAADEAELAIEWLNENGFIINETMSPYMQPYLDEGMVFVASKLVPGANVDEIRPLKLTYVSETPSIPLRLTAIAAEPHMMVTAFIFANEEYEAGFHPEVELDVASLFTSPRSNYPVLLSRQVDELGADAFIKEYSGPPPVWADPTGCCSDQSGSGDWCGVGGDGLCQCPGSNFDAADCAEQEELTEAVTLATRLSTQYTRMTRLSTRVSPEEMYFDPEFQPAGDTRDMRLTAAGTRYAFDSCEELLIDKEEHDEIVARELCSNVYCDYGTCAVTAAGAGCVCDEGFVARIYTESDGASAVTCVPEVGRVDFSAGGLDVPDACAGVDVDGGTCADVGGFPTVSCEAGLAAVVAPGGSPLNRAPQCAEITQATESKGATNYSSAKNELDACERPPPSCPANGWLEEVPVTIEGVDCGTKPDTSWFTPTPKPVCGQSAPMEAVLAAPAAAVEAMADPEPRDTTQPRPARRTSGACTVQAAGSSPSPFWWVALLVASVCLRGRRS